MSVRELALFVQGELKKLAAEERREFLELMRPYYEDDDEKGEEESGAWAVTVDVAEAAVGKRVVEWPNQKERLRAILGEGVVVSFNPVLDERERSRC